MESSGPLHASLTTRGTAIKRPSQSDVGVGLTIRGEGPRKWQAVTPRARQTEWGGPNGRRRTRRIPGALLLFLVLLHRLHCSAEAWCVAPPCHQGSRRGSAATIPMGRVVDIPNKLRVGHRALRLAQCRALFNTVLAPLVLPAPALSILTRKTGPVFTPRARFSRGGKMTPWAFQGRSCGPLDPAVLFNTH